MSFYIRNVLLENQLQTSDNTISILWIFSNLSSVVHTHETYFETKPCLKIKVGK